MNPLAYRRRSPGLIGGLIYLILVVVATLESSAAVPYAHTQATGPISGNSVTLSGMAVPNGQPTTAWFEWGTRGNFNQSTAPVSVGNGTSVVRVSAPVSSLIARTTYQCRLIASNSTGITYGAMKLFTTGEKVINWGYYSSPVPPGLSNVVGIAAGESHSLILRNNGTVGAWGYNYYNQTNAPAFPNDVIAVAAGNDHSLALRNNGTVTGWGYNYYGQTSTPDWTSVIAIACGSYHSLALRADGTILARGNNSSGQATVPQDVTNIISIACGDSFNVAVLADGTVRAWGGNYYNETNVPAGLTNVVDVAAASDHILALRANETVVAWGFNNYQTANGPTNVPTGLSNVVGIGAGRYASYAIQKDGSLVSWGSDSGFPIGVSNAVTISARDYYNRLALGNVTPQAQTRSAHGIPNRDLVISLTATDLNTDPLNFRITTLPTHGTLYQFNAGVRGAIISNPNTLVTDSNARVIFVPGLNEFGSPYSTFNFVANDGMIDSSPAPLTVNIQNSRAFTTAAGNIRPTSATLNGFASPNGIASTAWFEWGERRTYSQTTTPQSVGNGTGVAHLSGTITNLIEGRAYQYRLVVSNSFGVGLGAVQWFTTGERYVTWGDNSYGQATLDPNLTNLVAVASGGFHKLALQNNGTVLAWGAGGLGQAGSSHYGQSTVPDGLSNIVAIAASYANSLALKSDGTVTAWGYSYSGLDIVPDGLSNVVAIATSGFHNLALRSNGTVVAWGWNERGQTNVPTTLSNVVGIACGSSLSLALRADGTVAAWGQSSSSQIPVGLDNVVAVSAYYALRSDGTITGWYPYSSSSGPLNASNAVAITDYGNFLDVNGNFITGDDWVVASGLTNMIAVDPSGDILLGNAVPQPQEKVIIDAANRDLVIGLSGSDANGSALVFRITTLPAVGTLYQYSGGVRGSPITATNTLLTDASNRLIFVPDSDQFASPYASFSYKVNDGLLDSPPANVTVHIQQSRTFTQSATHLRSTTARLSGMALPNSFAATGWFEWGTRGKFDQTTSPVFLGNGYSVVRVSTIISNLIPGGSYQCRLVVSNVNGLIRGATQLFTTGEGVRSWGYSNFGQTNIPAGLSNIVAIAGGEFHSLALRNDGTAVAWGAGTNNSGYPHYGQSEVPAGLTNIIAVSAGDDSSIALREDGALQAWGATNPGPTELLESLTNVIAISSGRDHNLALRSDGTVASWGDNSYYGQNIVPAGLSNVVAIACGNYHSLALKVDGTVTAWGENYDNQSIVPPDLLNVVGISAGNCHSLALFSNGNARGWGAFYYNHDGGIPIPFELPAGLTNSLAVGSGLYHCLVIGPEGDVLTRGFSYYSPDVTNAPENLAGVVAVAGGGYHSLTLGGDILPFAISQVVTGAANQDIVITLNATNILGTPMTKVVRALPSLGSLYQFNSGSRNARVANPNTEVADSSGRIIYAPAPNGFGNPYSSFAFTANDGALDSLPATVTINLLPPLQPTITSLDRNPAGSSQLTFTGHSNTTYCVWASSNLATWEYLGLPTQPTLGTFQFLDAASSNFAQRFYRISTGCGTPPPQLSATSSLKNGVFDLRFSAGPYWTYRVWASTNLVNWEMIGTADESQPGSFRFSDTSATSWPQRFYKAGAP